MNYASAGIGAASHIAAERFRVAAGLEAQHVPFRGPNEALSEVVAGRIDYYFLPIAAGLSLMQSGKLTALGGEHAETLAADAGRADDRRSRLSGRRVSFLGRPVRSGEDAQRHREAAL